VAKSFGQAKACPTGLQMVDRQGRTCFSLSSANVLETFAFVGIVLILALSSASGQAQSTGIELFNKRCGGCHALDRDKEGPRLGDVYGRPAGSVNSFQYSDALRNRNLTWNDESLDKWLTDPEQLVPNNDMAFRLENSNERREIIGFLKQYPGK
jgi:cytochrome c